MTKFKSVALLILGIAGCYAVLAIFVKFLADTTVSVNNTLAAGSNMSQYPGTSGFLLSTPWLLFFVPAIIGIIWIIVILRRQEV